MKQKYVPIGKQSKRKQKEFHSTQRRDWGDLNPVTRKVPNLKVYDRKKSKHRYRHEPCLDFFLSRRLQYIQKTQAAPRQGLRRTRF